MAKIAYIGIKGLPSKGGAERVVEAIVRRLRGRHELTVYCNKRYTPPDTSMPGVRLIRIQTFKGKHSEPTSLFIQSCFHALLFGNYDVIHLHNIEPCFVLPFIRVKYKVIATAHGSTIRGARSKWGHVARKLMGLTEYPFLLFSNCATSVSKIDKEYFERRYGKKVLYIPNGVEEQPVMPQNLIVSVLQKFGLEEGKYVLFAAGRIDPTKGCHLVLEAFCRLNLDLKLVEI